MSTEAGTSSTSKAVDPATNGGFRPQVNMTVEPPKAGDLQKSYASIVGEVSNTNGWYGGMSRFPLQPPAGHDDGRDEEVSSR